MAEALLGVGDSPQGVPTRCSLSGSPGGGPVSWGGSECPIGEVCKSWLPWGLWGWTRSCDRDTSSQAEKLAPVKFYWTPFQPGALHSCRAACTPLSPGRSSVHLPEGRREGGQKEGAGDRSSAPGVGPSLSPQNRPKGPQSSRPTNPSCRVLGQPLWSVLGRLRGWRVPVGHPPGCPAPRAIGGGCSGPVSRPVLQLRVLLGCLPIAGVRLFHVAANILLHLGNREEGGGSGRCWAGLGAPGRHKLANPARPYLVFLFLSF